MFNKKEKTNEKIEVTAIDMVSNVNIRFYTTTKTV